MSSICQFDEFTKGSKCLICSKPLPMDVPQGTRRICTAAKPHGLGDWVENWLTSWGLTKDKYKELKEELGLPPTCNCSGRKEWLNKAGALLGIASDRYGPNRKKNQ